MHLSVACVLILCYSALHVVCSRCHSSRFSPHQMASFAYGSVRPSYAKPQPPAAQPTASAASADSEFDGKPKQTLQTNVRRTTLRDPFAPNLDNPLMCSPTAREFAEKQRTKIQQLPDRFLDPANFHFNAQKQHPAYRTSSNVHGSQEPTEIEMPMAYFSVDSSFSTSLGNSNYRNQSLAVTKSRKPIGY